MKKITQTRWLLIDIIGFRYDKVFENIFSLLMNGYFVSVRSFKIAVLFWGAVAQWWSSGLENRQPKKVCRFESYLRRFYLVVAQLEEYSFHKRKVRGLVPLSQTMPCWLNWYSIGLESRHSERISGFKSQARRSLIRIGVMVSTLGSEPGDNSSNLLCGTIGHG